VRGERPAKTSRVDPELMVAVKEALAQLGYRKPEAPDQTEP
jgi:hypothetical protein